MMALLAKQAEWACIDFGKEKKKTCESKMELGGMREVIESKAHSSGFTEN